MIDASTEPMIEERDTGVEDKVLESAIERKKTKKERKKGNRKEKEGAKDGKLEGDTPPPIKIQEDIMMKGIDRYSPYEDLSEYEKELEDAAPVNPPITKKQTTKRQVVLAKAGKPNPDLPNTSQPPRQSTKTNMSSLWSTESPATDPWQRLYRM